MPVHRESQLFKGGVPGEIRGGEAFDPLQFLNTGHSRTLSTVHANSAAQGISHFTTCVLESDVEIPLPAESGAAKYGPVRWSEDGVLQISAVGESSANASLLRFKKTHGQWTRIASSQVPEEPVSKVQIELRQGLNTPPALYAVDSAAHAEELIRDPNSQLKGLALGRVELVHWEATDGRPWTGELYYPVHFQAGRRFPLVIQTHGYSPNQFQPDGAFTTVFAAQALANHDIAVLQVGGPDTCRDRSSCSSFPTFDTACIYCRIRHNGSRLRAVPSTGSASG
jgi:Type II/IV secretion system protein